MRDVATPLALALPWVLIAVAGFELLHVFAGVGWARGAAHVAMGAVVVAAIPRLGGREAFLLSASAVAAAALVWLAPDPWAAARRAMDQAVFLMAFVLVISQIQEAARTSASVEALGLYLARQPGGRRFLGLFGGTMGMAILFNLSTVTLLAPLIRRAAEAAPDDPLTPVRERRQLNAHLRGFAWSVIWSPTAIAPIALMGLIEGIDRAAWIATGFVISLVMMAIGWAEDRWTFRRQIAAARGRPARARPPLPVGALVRFLTVCTGFAATAGAVILATGKGIPAGLMAAVPVLVMAWLVAQRADLAERARHLLAKGLPNSAPMCVTLAAAGFLGIAAAELLPAEDLARHLDLAAWPAWAFMLAITLGVVALSQFGLSPIMMAVFFGAVLGRVEGLPTTPTETAIACAAGWSVSTTISPFASGVIMLARTTGHRETVLSWRWNGLYTALTVIALALSYAVISGGR